MTVCSNDSNDFGDLTRLGRFLEKKMSEWLLFCLNIPKKVCFKLTLKIFADWFQFCCII